MNSDKQAVEERRKYVTAFNDTMIKIWKEQITLLGVIDTGQLLNSVVALSTKMDAKAAEVTVSEAFLEYGLWQDYGTGRETPRGHSGLAKGTRRKRRRWFSRKYFASVFNIRDFMAESLGREFCGVVSNAFDRKRLTGRI
ncbi:MAG: hypothetical protein Q4B68_10635 [Bacteroidales bacterium]|nr:hypothetical protein [Bacteroidales bacterium]